MIPNAGPSRKVPVMTFFLSLPTTGPEKHRAVVQSMRWIIEGARCFHTFYLTYLPDPFRPLDPSQEDLFTTADEKRAVTLQAFLRASPHPAMVRRVLLGHPTAARSALRLALTPLQPNSGPSVPFVHALSTTSKKAEAELAARVIDSTHRMEAFQPLEGLESVERLLRSPAGAVALSTVLGFEARQDYVHGADFEANSCLGPLLIALPCVLPFKQHFRAASETLKETIAGASVGLPSNRVPVAHRLAKRAAELMALKTSHNAKPLARQFNAYLGQVSRNRQAFVELIQAALVKVCCAVVLIGRYVPV